MGGSGCVLYVWEETSTGNDSSGEEGGSGRGVVAGCFTCLLMFVVELWQKPLHAFAPF